MAQSEEELKNLLMKVKVESEKVGLKLNIKKVNINILNMCLPIKGMVQIASTQSTNTVNASTYMQRICIGVEK